MNVVKLGTAAPGNFLSGKREREREFKLKKHGQGKAQPIVINKKKSNSYKLPFCLIPFKFLSFAVIVKNKILLIQNEGIT